MMNTLAKRTIQRRIELHMSQQQLADKAGVRQSTIGNIEAGSRKNPRDLLAIARALQVHPDWLKSGIGEKELPSDDYQPDFVRRIHQRLSAGSGHAAFYDAKESWLAFQPKFLQSVGVSPKNAAIFDVSGRSMEPELHDGAVVLINMNARYESIIDGKHYAFIHDDECKVKTLYKLKDGSIRAVSQNPDKEMFPDFIIPNNKHEKLEILGLVLWEGRTV